MKHHRASLFLALAWRICLPSAMTLAVDAQTLIISAPDHYPRLPELVEIPMKEVLTHTRKMNHFKAIDTATHEPLVTQVYSDPDSPDHDLLLIAVTVPASGSLSIELAPTDDMQVQRPLVFGREAQERKDDYAWENEYVTYRVYGPALEATGEVASGIDVWSKRVPNFVIDRFYKRDAEGQRTHNPALSYHKDDGIGLDSYLVGPTRGCGGTGVLSSNKLFVSKNYTHLKQISSGPVRFEFELTYEPWMANGIEVTETKRITLDAGSRLNKIQSTFTFAGGGTIQAAAGLAVHPGADFEELSGGHILSVWDTPQDPAAGTIATGMISAMNEHVSALRLEPDGLLVFPVRSGQTFTYYAGSGWSKADMADQGTWNKYLLATSQQMQHPLIHRWQGTIRKQIRTHQ